MIRREPQASADRSHDLIVVGGGIYGVALTLEATRRGLRSLLLERGDFGQATSANSLRIIHGGLRYLQSLDFRRFSTSVSERKWLMQNFSDLIHPLPCLMPLYNRGARRPSIFRLALGINDTLSSRRNVDVPPRAHLPASKVLKREAVIERFPDVDRNGLVGGALWHDGLMQSPQRVICEMLKWACHCGAHALNYVSADDLCHDDSQVVGVQATDQITNQPLSFKAPVVVNCAGPWCSLVAKAFDREIDDLFHPSLAFNLLLDRRPLSDAGLAVTAKKPGARTYFVVPWRDQTLAGTFHAPCDASDESRSPSIEQINAFLSELNDSIPGYHTKPDDVIRVDAGLLPAVQPGRTELVRSPQIVDHRERGGPRGLWSVSGVKYTTAREVAEQVARRVFKQLQRPLPPYRDSGRPQPHEILAYDDPYEVLHQDVEDVRPRLLQLIREESVLHVDDIVLRRTDWGNDPIRGIEAARRIGQMLGWSSERCEAELSKHLMMTTP